MMKYWIFIIVIIFFNHLPITNARVQCKVENAVTRELFYKTCQYTCCNTTASSNDVNICCNSNALSTTNKALLGTLVPVVSITFMVLGYIYYRKIIHKSRRTTNERINVFVTPAALRPVVQSDKPPAYNSLFRYGSAISRNTNAPGKVIRINTRPLENQNVIRIQPQASELTPRHFY